MNVLTWLDDVIELAPIVEKLLRDGFTLGLILSVAVFLVRKYRKKFPNQLDRIERKVDLLAERQGIEWAAHGLKPYGEASATRSKSPFISHWVEYITARIVNRNITFRITGKLRRKINPILKLLIEVISLEIILIFLALIMQIVI